MAGSVLLAKRLAKWAKKQAASPLPAVKC